MIKYVTLILLLLLIYSCNLYEQDSTEVSYKINYSVDSLTEWILDENQDTTYLRKFDTDRNLIREERKIEVYRYADRLKKESLDTAYVGQPIFSEIIIAGPIDSTAFLYLAIDTFVDFSKLTGYKIDTGHLKFEFAARHTGLVYFFGTYNQFLGAPMGIAFIDTIYVKEENKRWFLSENQIKTSQY